MASALAHAVEPLRRASQLDVETRLVNAEHLPRFLPVMSLCHMLSE